MLRRAASAGHGGGLVDVGVEVSTLGPLIHNPQVVSKLEASGVRVVDEVDEVRGGTVVIRSHGVTPSVRACIAQCGLEVADATCPHVARAQDAAAELARAGCHVLVVGEAGHPEVEGLVAYAREDGAAADVVLTPADIPDGIADPVGVVVRPRRRARIWIASSKPLQSWVFTRASRTPSAQLRASAKRPPVIWHRMWMPWWSSAVGIPRTPRASRRYAHERVRRPSMWKGPMR